MEAYIQRMMEKVQGIEAVSSVIAKGNDDIGLGYAVLHLSRSVEMDLERVLDRIPKPANSCARVKMFNCEDVSEWPIDNGVSGY